MHRVARDHGRRARSAFKGQLNKGGHMSIRRHFFYFRWRTQSPIGAREFRSFDLFRQSIFWYHGVLGTHSAVKIHLSPSNQHHSTAFGVFEARWTMRRALRSPYVSKQSQYTSGHGVLNSQTYIRQGTVKEGCIILPQQG